MDYKIFFRRNVRNSANSKVRFIYVAIVKWVSSIRLCYQVFGKLHIHIYFSYKSLATPRAMELMVCGRLHAGNEVKLR